MEAETHKEARGKNYSDFINENTDKKQGSNDLYKHETQNSATQARTVNSSLRLW